MCGIAGWAGPSDAPAMRDLAAMQRSLAPRGPDGEGTWIGEGCALVHRRLAIIDPAGSPQPMADSSGQLVITYNGETYNYKALRRRLCEQGRRFRTAGDTEVLLELYRERGDAFVEELDAIFAFGLWDAPRRRLLLARDRVGVNPLYYWHDPATKGLLFASDLSSMLANRAVPRGLDLAALSEFLQLGYTIAPRTWLDGVRQLPPGHRLIWEEGRIRVEPYYAWRYDPAPELDAPGAAAAELSRRLGESVESQLVAADVPVCAFLSGGIDSSAVSAFAQQARGRHGETLQSFTVRFPDPEYDESARARAIAAQIGCRHEEVDASRLEFGREFLDAFVRGLGEPFGDTSALAVWSLCAQARRLGKVALSGDGGDELFFGYTGLRKQRQARRLRAVPDPIAQGAISVLSGSGATWPRRLAKALRLSRKDDTGLLIDWHRRWDVGALPGLLTPPRYDALFPEGEGEIPAVRELVGNGSSGFAERQIRFHMLVDLPSDCLFKVNRMSMAHGVEVRVPLLSNSLLEFGSRLPAAARHAGGRTKEPLRTVAEEMTPYLREPSRKHGFGFPLDGFLRGKIAPAWRSWGVTATLARAGFVPAALDALVARYETESASPGYASRHLSSRLFDLLLIALWVEAFEIRV